MIRSFKRKYCVGWFRFQRGDRMTHGPAHNTRCMLFLLLQGESKLGGFVPSTSAANPTTPMMPNVVTICTYVGTYICTCMQAGDGTTK